MKTKIFIFTLLLIFSSLLIFSACADDGNTYVVKINSDGGNINEIQELAPGEKVPKPDTPVKSGYTFVDWYYGDTVWNFDTDTVNGNIEITAKWTINTYTANFYVDGTLKHTHTFTVADGETLEGPELESREGYTHKWDDLTVKPQNLEINAVYTLIKYKIVYTNLQDSVSPVLITFTYDDFNAQGEIELQPLINEALAAQGIVFSEWHDKNENPITKISKSSLNTILKESTDDNGQKITLNEIVLTAIWSNGKKLLTYQEYNALDGAQKRKYYNSFPSPKDFQDWFKEAKAKYEAEQDRVIIDSEKPVEIA